MATFDGTSGDDIYSGSDAADRIRGNDGDDVLIGNGGNDLIDGGSGDDILLGGVGRDRLDGGDGIDTVSYAGAASAVTVTLLATAAQDTRGAGRDTLVSIENLTGSGFADTLTGSDTANVLAGSGGDDRIVAGAGADLIYGDEGDDTVDAGDGADILRGGDGRDTLHGGDGDDILQVDRSDDMVAGELYDGGTGNDALYLNYNSASDISKVTLTGIEEINQTYFNQDTRLTAAQLDAVAKISGQSFTLTTGGAVELAGVAINVETFTLANAGNSFDLTGSIQNYLLTVDGGARADTITGAALADRLNGGGGADVLAGADGDDTLDGGAGADRMTGGAGDDHYLVDSVRDEVIELAGGGYDTVESTRSFGLGEEVEALTLTGDAASAGTGNALANAITGNDAANVLKGLGGDDRLVGGGGGDVIVGGRGADTLTGGAGADQFRFGEGQTGAGIKSADLIVDFRHAEGDRIDLSAIDADAQTDGAQAFAFIGAAAFSGAAGELRYAVVDDITYVRGDTDGDGSADLVIALTGNVPLMASDFILTSPAELPA